jgi:hypothetical protein
VGSSISAKNQETPCTGGRPWPPHLPRFQELWRNGRPISRVPKSFGASAAPQPYFPAFETSTPTCACAASASKLTG